MRDSRPTPPAPHPDWLLEQQIRAEMEAEAWRRLREQISGPPALPPPAPEVAPVPPPRDYHRSGSTILKALVRFGLAAGATGLAYLAGMDSGLGEFEVWLAMGASFLVTLAITLFDPVRPLVHFLAETARWIIVVALAVGGLWLFMHMSGQV